MSHENKQNSLNPKIGCYYELDSKYSDSPNEEEIENWWLNKLESIKESGIQDDILSKEGSGPNGAEWNTYTDLYFVGLFSEPDLNLNSQDATDVLINVSINEKTIDHKLVRKQWNEDLILVDFMLEKEFWTKALRAIEAKDHIPLYGKERIELIENKEAIPIAPLNTGEIFKITIDVIIENNQKLSVTEYFHIAYGE